MPQNFVIMLESSELEPQGNCKVSKFHNGVLYASNGMSSEALFPFLPLGGSDIVLRRVVLVVIVYVLQYDVFFGASVS